MQQDLKKELIHFIIAQLRAIEGEMYILEAIKNSIDESKDPSDIFEVLKLIKQDFSHQVESIKKLHENQGKFEAYATILRKLESLQEL